MTIVIFTDFYVEKYRHGEPHARAVAQKAMAIADVFGCVFPASMLDLVPAEGYTIASLGHAYAEQGLDEEAFSVIRAP